MEKSTVVAAEEETRESAGELVFRCRRCRFILFTENNVKDHEIAKHTFDHKKVNKEKKRGVRREACNSYFLEEPTKWMPRVSESSRVKLLCPKCNGKVGNAVWMGTQCSCGTWVTPAFQFARNKVDPKVRRRKRTIDAD